MRGSVLLDLLVSDTPHSVTRFELTRDWLRETVDARDSVLERVSNLDMVMGGSGGDGDSGQGEGRITSGRRTRMEYEGGSGREGGAPPGQMTSERSATTPTGRTKLRFRVILFV